MNSLRTLNVRTMPPFVTVKMLYLDVSRSHFGDLVITSLLSEPHSRPPIETLAIGAFRYRDLRNGLGCEYIHEPEKYKYYRPQIYDVDRLYKFEGRYKPLAILREVGTYEKTKAMGPAWQFFRSSAGQSEVLLFCTFIIFYLSPLFTCSVFARRWWWMRWG